MYSLPGGGVERGLNYNQSMMKEINEEKGIEQIKIFAFKNFQIDNNKFMKIYKILVISEELQGIADKAKAYQAALPEKLLKGGGAYQEVYTSYIIPLD
ncbi:MAG: NUDIX domain-containing protein [Candidatus Midichloriaceae bacterium]